MPGLATTAVAAVVLASPASAQRRVELGLDGGAVFGLGDQSSINITVPGSRFRIGAAARATTRSASARDSGRK